MSQKIKSSLYLASFILAVIAYNNLTTIESASNEIAANTTQYVKSID